MLVDQAEHTYRDKNTLCMHTDTPLNVMDDNNIQLSREEMERIYQLWTYSLIIKLQG